MPLGLALPLILCPGKEVPNLSESLSDCYNKWPQTGRLKMAEISHSFGGQQVKVKVWTGLVSSKALGTTVLISSSW
jgi:hypothetical protein